MLALFDPVWPRSGLLSGDRTTESLRSLVGDWRIEDLPIPFAAVSVDLVTGEEVWIRSGRVIDAIRASISLPGIFVPVRQGAQLLVDGALRNPVPVTPLAELGARDSRRGEPARAAGARARAARAPALGGGAPRRRARDRARALARAGARASSRSPSTLRART